MAMLGTSARFRFTGDLDALAQAASGSLGSELLGGFDPASPEDLANLKFGGALGGFSAVTARGSMRLLWIVLEQGEDAAGQVVSDVVANALSFGMFGGGKEQVWAERMAEVPGAVRVEWPRMGALTGMKFI